MHLRQCLWRARLSWIVFWLAFLGVAETIFNYFVVAPVLLELSNLFLALGDRTLISKHYVAVKLNVYLCLQYGRILYPLISV